MSGLNSRKTLLIPRHAYGKVGDIFEYSVEILQIHPNWIAPLVTLTQWLQPQSMPLQLQAHQMRKINLWHQKQRQTRIYW